MIDVKWYLDSACIIDAETNETISTRALIDIANKMHNELNVPVSRAQTKTVADAVEWAKTGWLHNDHDVIIFNTKHGKHGLLYSKSECPLDDNEYLVCTREQFETYVKEQEGEKWTHTDTDDEPCKILIDEPDTIGRVLILRKNGWYVPIDRANLKPIKPTLSKAEAWSKMHEKAKYNKNYGLAIQQIKEKYDII